MKRKRLHVAGLVVSLLSLALPLAFLAQAGAARQQPNQVKRTAKPTLTLAMDGPRIAYMMSGRRVGVWNVVTGASSLIKGDYPSKGREFGSGTGEVAIAGERVALITRFVVDDSWQQTRMQERLYSASVGRSAQQLGRPTNHSTRLGDCTIPTFGRADGDWLAGLVGSGKILAVSAWTAVGEAPVRGSDPPITSHERLRLVTQYGLRTIASGPDTIKAQSVSGGRIAAFQSRGTWPGGWGLWSGTPTVSIYSATGVRLAQLVLQGVGVPGSCTFPSTFVTIALSGNQLVVLRQTFSQTFPLHDPVTSTLEVYNWRTGALVRTWPLQLGEVAGSEVPGVENHIGVSGPIALISGSFKPRLLNLTTGKQAPIAASRPGSPATIGSRGLVYAVNPAKNGGRSKLVFVPSARLFAMVK